MLLLFHNSGMINFFKPSKSNGPESKTRTTPELYNIVYLRYAMERPLLELARAGTKYCEALLLLSPSTKILRYKLNVLL